jgi:malate dehydrogenase
MKVTIVGAGNVGATCADVIFYKCEKVLEGRKLDIMQCYNTGFNTRVSCY